MTELRDYILSKLQEQLGKAQRNPAGEKAVANWKMKRRVGKPGGPVRVGQSHTGEAAALHMEKQAGELKGKLKSRAFRGLGQTQGGMRAWSNIQQGHSPDARQDASTDLRTQLAYVLADKLEELKQSTVDSAAAKRVAQVRSKDFRGEEKPVFKGGTGGTDKPEQIDTRSGAGKGVIGKRLATLYKGKTSKGVAKKREDSSTNLKDRMVDILFEAFTGTSRDYVARAMSREGKGSSMKDRSKKGKALASVVNKQPKVVKAKAEKDAADDAQRKANMAKGGNSNLRSRDSATHPRNNWPSGSWGSA